MPHDKLLAWEGNPNLGDIDAVAASIERFGFIAPICIWTSRGRMVAGHTRLLAFRMLLEADATFIPRGAPGLGLVPVRWHEFRDEADAEAYALADNRLSELAKTDDRKLAAALERIRRADKTLPKIAGFDETKLAVVRARAERVPQGDPDKLPPAPTVPRVKAGDVWLLGDHRLLCGDSFVEENRALILDRLADAVVMDPPYAIYGSSTGIGADIADDKMVRPFFEQIFRASFASVKEFGHVYVCCDWRSYPAIAHGAHAARLSPKNVIVWDKDNGVGSMYAQCHEFVAFFVREPPATAMRGAKGKRTGHRMVMRKNIVHTPRVAGSEKVHNAQKPAELLKELVTNSTDAGDVVVDFFGGAGTTLIVCEILGRRARVFEIEPRECDKILVRWEALTGKKAALQVRRVETPVDAQQSGNAPALLASKRGKQGKNKQTRDRDAGASTRSARTA
jgi:DNA modification methylase